MLNSLRKSKTAKGLVGLLSPLVLASGIYFSTPKFSHANPVSDFISEQVDKLIDSVLKDLTGKTYEEIIKDVSQEDEEEIQTEQKKKELCGILYLKDGTIMKNVRCKDDEFIFLKDKQKLKVPKEKILAIDFSKEKDKDILYLRDGSIIKNVQYEPKELEVSWCWEEGAIHQDKIKTLVFGKIPKTTEEKTTPKKETPNQSTETRKPVLTKDEITSLFKNKLNEDKVEYDIAREGVKFEQGKFTTSQEPEAVVSFSDTNQSLKNCGSEIWLLRYTKGKWEIDRKLGESHSSKFETIDIQRDGRLEVLIREDIVCQGCASMSHALISIDGRTINILYSNKGWDNTGIGEEGEAVEEYTIRFLDTDRDRVLEIIETGTTETYAWKGERPDFDNYKKISSKSKETVYKLKGNKYVKISETPEKSDLKPAKETPKKQLGEKITLERITHSADHESRPRWSPDGKKILFTSRKRYNTGTDILVMDIGSGNTIRLAEGAPGDIKLGSHWSPDGKKIIFTSNKPFKTFFPEDKSEFNFEIYIMDSNGKNIKRLTRNTTEERDPSWSPDGKKIIFSSTRLNNWKESDIYVMNINGTGLKRLTHSGSKNASPSWSPDGKKIIFISDIEEKGNYNMYIMNADGSNIKRISRYHKIEALPRWSPDGKKIAFSANKFGYNSEDFEVHIMNTDGSDVRTLTKNPATDLVGSWSPDGKKIVFSSDREGDYDIYIMHLD